MQRLQGLQNVKHIVRERRNRSGKKSARVGEKKNYWQRESRWKSVQNSLTCFVLLSGVHMEKFCDISHSFPIIPLSIRHNTTTELYDQKLTTEQGKCLHKCIHSIIIYMFVWYNLYIAYIIKEVVPFCRVSQLIGMALKKNACWLLNDNTTKQSQGGYILLHRVTTCYLINSNVTPGK